jgi:hypothetical protein
MLMDWLRDRVIVLRLRGWETNVWVILDAGREDNDRVWMNKHLGTAGTRCITLLVTIGCVRVYGVERGRADRAETAASAELDIRLI